MRLFRRLGRHAYGGLAFAADEQRRLVAALGDLDGLILENHGILTVGRTVAEAFVLMSLVERAAQVQIAAMAATGGRPLVVPDAVAEATYRQWIGDGATPEGAEEWPALLRSLDDPVSPNP
jgi:ribulose-5-phosphate 4-epimerase/fuculose-1-phosphate aldolase